MLGVNRHQKKLSIKILVAVKNFKMNSPVISLSSTRTRTRERKTTIRTKNDENKRTKDDWRTRHKKVWEDFEMKIIFLAISMRDRLAAFETEARTDQLTAIKSPD